MAKKWGRGWLCGGVLLLAGAVIGYLLLVLVYCLPTERMQQHLESCVDAFSQGGCRWSRMTPVCGWIT